MPWNPNQNQTLGGMMFGRQQMNPYGGMPRGMPQMYGGMGGAGSMMAQMQRPGGMPTPTPVSMGADPAAGAGSSFTGMPASDNPYSNRDAMMAAAGQQDSSYQQGMAAHQAAAAQKEQLMSQGMSEEDAHRGAMATYQQAQQGPQAGPQGLPVSASGPGLMEQYYRQAQPMMQQGYGRGMPQRRMMPQPGYGRRY